VAQTDILGAEVTETLRGIGAQDKDYIPALNRYPLQAGEIHSMARYEANWTRMRAFDRIPSYAVLEPAGNHPPNGATEAELRLGCPAWPL
jgi:hypothetical protein